MFINVNNQHPDKKYKIITTHIRLKILKKISNDILNSLMKIEIDTTSVLLGLISFRFSIECLYFLF